MVNCKPPRSWGLDSTMDKFFYQVVQEGCSQSCKNRYEVEMVLNRPPAVSHFLPPMDHHWQGAMGTPKCRRWHWNGWDGLMWATKILQFCRMMDESGVFLYQVRLTAGLIFAACLLSIIECRPRCVLCPRPRSLSWCSMIDIFQNLLLPSGLWGLSDFWGDCVSI